MKRNTQISRRLFIKQLGAATAPLVLPSRMFAAASPNAKLNIAVIGTGIRSLNLIEEALRQGGNIVALCDVDAAQIADTKTKISKKLPDIGGAAMAKVRVYDDYRKLLEAEKSFDAVMIGTGSRWHAPLTVVFMKAGKHIYCEKPLVNKATEAREIAALSRASKVVTQTGTQGTSAKTFRRTMEIIEAGLLGQVREVHLWCCLFPMYPPSHNRPEGEDPVPTGFNWDFWLGPAPLRPFNRNRFHYNWHWNWDYGCGDMGNQGVHEMDIARWGLGVTLPTKVCAMGGHVMFDDDQQTPNVLHAMFEFPNPAGGGEKKKFLQFEVRHWVTNNEIQVKEPVNDGTGGYGATSAGNSVGNLFYGSKGYMAKTVNAWQAFMGEKREPGEAGKGEGNHYANFVNAIRDPHPETFNRSIEDGFHSCALV
ncbi:MAG: Gfo/Idh/MocA family oxidoreductase, partial [Verrucomicrobia bacterium]|nr:Gfo/Idh/MocA family oxidoreductase [Verrucomicrobiota bacterium]